MIRILIAFLLLLTVGATDVIMMPKISNNNDNEVKNKITPQPDHTPENENEKEDIIETPKYKSFWEDIYISKGNMILGTITLVTIIICLLPNSTLNIKKQ